MGNPVHSRAGSIASPAIACLTAPTAPDTSTRLPNRPTESHRPGPRLSSPACCPADPAPAPLPRTAIGAPNDNQRPPRSHLSESSADRRVPRPSPLVPTPRPLRIGGFGLKRLDEQRHHLLSGNRYARYSDSCKFHEALAPALREFEGLIREHLEREAKEALGRLGSLEPVEGFEEARREANSLFVSNNAPTVQASAHSELLNPLTNEQAEAIATDEDVTLVLAGAGTGKTSVVVGKVAHLIRNQGVSPNEILVLTFNRKAAAEIRARLTGDLSTAHVHTFHSFGRRVIADSETAPTISKLAEDEMELTRAVSKIVGEFLNDPNQSKAVIDYIVYHHTPYRSAFDFHTRAEYDEYVQSVELRTLSGVLVNSFEELVIANYLTEHGVEFRYEDPYMVPTATRQRGQYRPDFFLPDYAIYIEHFALNEQGRPPPGWRQYAEDVEWKRSTHRLNRSKLTETYSWQHRQGVLLPTLRKQLEEEGVLVRQIET